MTSTKKKLLIVEQKSTCWYRILFVKTRKVKKKDREENGRPWTVVSLEKNPYCKIFQQA